MAIPLACEEKLLNIHLPSHSSDTVCSIVLQILESVTIIKSAFFWDRNFKILLRLGFRPILLELKQIILNFEAELTHSPPILPAVTQNQVKHSCAQNHNMPPRKVLLYKLRYVKCL